MLAGSSIYGEASNLGSLFIPLIDVAIDVNSKDRSIRSIATRAPWPPQIYRHLEPRELHPPRN
jgi:hypothetical protein